MTRYGLYGGLALALVAFVGRCAFADNLCLRGPQQRALPHGALSVGDTLRLRAGGVDILTECDLAPPRSVRWSSSDEAVLRVSEDGLVSAGSVWHREDYGACAADICVA